MTDDVTGSNVFLIIIVLFFFFMLFAGGNGFGWGGNRAGAFLAGEAYGGNFGWNNQAILSAVCNSEKQAIIDSARTNYNIEAQSAIIQTKMDTNVINQLRDELGQERAKSMYLQSQLENNARFYALDSKLNDISCNMLKAPKVYGQSFTCDGTKIPTATTTTPAA